jgi:hypothetical protein
VIGFGTVLGLLFPGRGGATVVTSTNSFLGPDSVVTFETGTTALPSVTGLTFSPYGTGADSTFSSDLFGRQVYGDISGFGGYSDLFVKFSPLVTEVGAYAGAFGGSTPSHLTVNVYGLSDQLLESTTVSTLSVGSVHPFAGFIESQGISEIDWLGGNQGFFDVDNVTYGGPEPVPEPSSRALIMVFFAAAILLCKQARQNRLFSPCRERIRLRVSSTSSE